MTKYKNVLRGRKAQSVGQIWEDIIQTRARQSQEIILIKQHPQVQFYENGRSSVIGTAWPDYIALGKNISFTFDAKSTQNKSKLTMPHNRRHQFLSLQLAHFAGIPSFYLVYWRSARKITANKVDQTSRWPFCAEIDVTVQLDFDDESWFLKLIKSIKNGEL